MPDGLQPEQANLQVEQARMMLGVRIGVCSDVHGRHDRLLAVLAAMAAAGVDERWCAWGIWSDASRSRLS